MKRLSKATWKIVRQVEELERPEGISKVKWRGVRTLLIAIAKHYPRPYPSQETLAAETGYDVRSIRRYQAAAIDAGLLLVKADAGRKGAGSNWSKTNRYLIQGLPVDDKLSSSVEDSLSSEPYGLRPTGMSDSHSSSMSDESSELAALVRALRWHPDEPGREEESKQVRNRIDRSSSPRPSKRTVAKSASDYAPKPHFQPIKPPSDPPRWKFCAEYFAREWDEMVVKTQRNDPLRQVRPTDSYVHCRNYLNAHFFGRTASAPKTISQVVDMIDEFIDNAYRGRVKIKSGQSAWMCFTGAWGRNKITANSTAASTAAYVPPQHRDK